MKVELQRGVPPPKDIGLLPPWLQPRGEWIRFSTPNAHAFVFATSDVTGHAGYIVHWIGSDNPGGGEGSSILAAVGQWADSERASGTLICEPDMVEWYVQRGWQQFDVFNGMAVMARFYRAPRD